MAAGKSTRGRRGPSPAPLPPEAAGALQCQVAAVAAALKEGLDPQALQDLVTPNPADLQWDLHLLAALGDLRHPAIPLLLANLFGSSPDQLRRKALKRAFHLLKTRGVPVSGELLPREEPLIRREAAPPTRAQVSPILANGDSLVVLEGPKNILGGNFLVAFLNDAAGFRECQLLSLKSQQQKEFWDEYRRHGLAEWFLVPGPYAVRLLEEAYATSDHGGAAAQTYQSLRERLWKNWGPPEQAPDLEQILPAPEPGERQRLLAAARQLASEPLFRSWLPGSQELGPWLQKLQEIQESPLVLAEHQKQGRLEALVEEAARALYPPEERPRWRRRLLAMAYYLHVSGRGELSRMARAAADDLAASPGGVLARENSFLTGLVSLSLQLDWEASRNTRAPDPGRLLTLPGDLRPLGR